MDILRQYSNEITMLICAILGSFRANLLNTSKKSLCVRYADATIGIVIGLVIGLHFLINNAGFYAYIVCIIASTIGCNILDVIQEISPNIAKKLIKNKFKGK